MNFASIALITSILVLGLSPALSQIKPGIRRIELPPETGSFASAPGSEYANGQCLTCHSVEYVLIQPPFPRAFWAAEVKKMREKYGASIPDDQVDPLVDYLAVDYGTETNIHLVAIPAPDAKRNSAGAPTLGSEAMVMKFGCLSCHNVKVKIVGPAYKDVADKYRTDPAALDKICRQIHDGGSGKWGPVIMPPFPNVSDADARMIAGWIMSQGASK